MTAPFRILGAAFDGGVLRASYRAEVLGVPRRFVEVFDFGTAGLDRPEPALLRLVALVAATSYYKATPSTEIVVEFPVTEADLAYLELVIRRGMGEYAYRNDLPAKLRPTIIPAAGLLPSAAGATLRPLGEAVLVPVGGGRDSVVTIEALKAAGIAATLVSANGRGAIHDCVAVARLPYLEVRRVIDPELLRSNAAGAPNGHVPVTAIHSAVALLAADLHGLGTVVFSNEHSAEYGNVDWAGQRINHQWSKSLEAEDALRAWLDASGLGADRLCSLVRGFDELDMAQAFSGLEAYFPVFSSCNRAYAAAADASTPRWCGECPKCLFVFLTLAPFVERDALLGIFGRDLLDEPANLPLVRDIVGLGALKPFDCVGEPDEAQWALAQLAARAPWRQSAVVRALAPSLPAAPIRRPSAPREDRVPSRLAAARDHVRAAL